MAVTWSKFFPYVQPYVPGCPEVVIESHLQEAAAEFAMRSSVWRVVIDRDFTSKSTPDYKISVPNGTVLENILHLNMDGLRLQRVTDKHYSIPLDDRGKAILGRPMKYAVVGDDTVQFFPTPDKTYGFEGLAVVKPKLTATGVEDFIFETHGRTIAAGAISRIAGIPNKEWSNSELAMYYRGLFNRDSDAAAGRDTRGSNIRVAAVGFDSTPRRRRK